MANGCVLTVERLLNGKLILLNILKPHMSSPPVINVKFVLKLVKPRLPFALIKIESIKIRPNIVHIKY